MLGLNQKVLAEGPGHAQGPQGHASPELDSKGGAKAEMHPSPYASILIVQEWLWLKLPASCVFSMPWIHVPHLLDAREVNAT